MGDDICIGRKEIIAFFKKMKIISENLENEVAWIRVIQNRKKYKMQQLFHKHYNGKPKIIKSEIIKWLIRTDCE